MLQHGYSICVAYEKQKCQKLDAKVYVWIVCDPIGSRIFETFIGRKPQ